MPIPPKKTFTYVKDLSRTYECEPTTPKEHYTQFCCSDYKLVPRINDVGSLQVVANDNSIIILSSFQIENNERAYFTNDGPDIDIDYALNWQVDNTNCYLAVQNGGIGLKKIIIKKDYITLADGKKCYKVKK